MNTGPRTSLLPLSVSVRVFRGKRINGLPAEILDILAGNAFAAAAGGDDCDIHDSRAFLNAAAT